MKREPMFRRYLRFWGADPRRDVDDELDFHLEMRVAEFEQSGMSREEAERVTRDRFGDVRGIHHEVEELTVKEAATPLSATAVAPVKPDPEIVTVVPPCVDPDAGDIDVTEANGAFHAKTSAATGAL